MNTLRKKSSDDIAELIIKHIPHSNEQEFYRTACFIFTRDILHFFQLMDSIPVYKHSTIPRKASFKIEDIVTFLDKEKFKEALEILENEPSFNKEDRIYKETIRSLKEQMGKVDSFWKKLIKPSIQAVNSFGHYYKKGE